MSDSLYFYDLETSGVSPKNSRIMQFAGQRTDQDLNPIGEPDDFYIKLNKDTLPEPDAVLLHGITPQRTLAEGLSEPEFLKYFDSDIAKPGTIFLGYNTIRFDDEFMRYTRYRNFYDAYDWQWKDDRSRWDLLDVVRMMRALRPEGINWPFAPDGSPTNRLESLTSVNDIAHDGAHTALSDVKALISLAQKIRKVQPQLFDYLRDMRFKDKVRSFAQDHDLFIYTSGAYESRYEKTTVVTVARALPDNSGAIVYDCRYDPSSWSEKDDQKLYQSLTERQENPEERLPFKVMQFNRCPALAPLGVLDEKSRERLAIDLNTVSKNMKNLHNSQTLITRVEKLFDARKKSFQTSILPDESSPDTRLYDNFLPDTDKPEMKKVQSASKAEIASLSPTFHDDRLRSLWPLYKARNYPTSLTESERKIWEDHIARQLFSGAQASKYMKFITRIEELSKTSLTKDKQYLLEELRLYGESIAPGD